MPQDKNRAPRRGRARAPKNRAASARGYRRLPLFIGVAVAVVVVAVGAFLLLNNGDDEKSGAGFLPVSLTKIKPMFSKEAQRIYVRAWYAPKEQGTPLVVCEATGPDNKIRRMDKASIGIVEPGIAQVGIPFRSEDPDGLYRVACASSKIGMGRVVLFKLQDFPELPRVEGKIEIKNDPDFVVVKKVEGQFELPTFQVSPDKPPAPDKTVQQQAAFTLYKSGRVIQQTQSAALEYHQTSGDVYQTDEIRITTDVRQTYELAFVPEGVFITTVYKFANGNVYEAKALWTLLTPAAASPSPVSRQTATP